MPKITEAVLLDYKDYIENTRQWYVSILNIPGITLRTITINGFEIPSHEYKVDSSYIIFSNEVAIHSSDKAHANIEFNSGNYRLSFWLPIILAIIGLAGTLAQPILHELGYLYTSQRKCYVDYTSIAVDSKKNAIVGSITVIDLKDMSGCISEADLKNWNVYIAAKEDEDTKDADMQQYPYFSGPYELDKSDKPIYVQTDSIFMNNITKDRKKILFIMTLIRKGTPVNPPFSPLAFREDDIRLLSKSYLNTQEGIQF